MPEIRSLKCIQLHILPNTDDSDHFIFIGMQARYPAPSNDTKLYIVHWFKNEYQMHCFYKIEISKRA